MLHFSFMAMVVMNRIYSLGNWENDKEYGIFCICGRHIFKTLVCAG